MRKLFKSKSDPRPHVPAESADHVQAGSEPAAVIAPPRNEPDIYVSRPELGRNPGSGAPSMREAYRPSEVGASAPGDRA
jgi:hypothetical protein